MKFYNLGHKTFETDFSWELAPFALQKTKEMINLKPDGLHFISLVASVTKHSSVAEGNNLTKNNLFGRGKRSLEIGTKIIQKTTYGLKRLILTSYP